MKASDFCFELIKFFEDFRIRPYDCPGGVRTIGYGHAIVVGDRFSVPIREFEAESLLFDDVSKKQKLLTSILDQSIVKAMRQYQWDALVSFTYNVKESLVRRSTLIRLVNENQQIAATQEFHKWIFAGTPKTVLPGLVLRREIESRLYAGMMRDIGINELRDYIEGTREELKREGRLA
jgi:lysozyme